MLTTPFTVGVRRSAHAAIIDLHGELNRQADQAFGAAYAEATQTDPACVLLNFSDVTYINSTGIALIVGLLAQARKEQRPLRAYGLSDHYTQIFHLTRLADFIAIFTTESAALAKDDGVSESGASG